MITYKHALEKISDLAQKIRPRLTKVESISIEESVGRISAESIYVTEPQPLFDNSAMDGFVIRSEWTCDASTENLKEFEVVACLAAGETYSGESRDPCCFEIMTGALIPTGFDSVLRVEDSKVIQRGDKHFLVISEPLQKWSQIRRQGEDFALKDVIVSSGEKICASHVLALASQGQGRITVKAPIRIGIISTGSELVAHQEKPKEGMIRNTTLSYFVAKSKSPNVDFKVLGIVGDSPEKFKVLVQSALSRFDILITTGAVSMGRFDIIPTALAELGALQHFHKVAMRPGKPLLFAEFEEGPLVFGFPGNPLSGVVAHRFFLEPLLRALLGTEAEKSYYFHLAEDVKKPEGLCCFWKAKVENVVNKGTTVKALKGQESFRIKPLIEADHWVVLPEGKGLYEAGEIVEAYPVASAY